MLNMSLTLLLESSVFAGLQMLLIFTEVQGLGTTWSVNSGPWQGNFIMPKNHPGVDSYDIVTL